MALIWERAGSVVPDIYVVWDANDWTEPVGEEQYDSDRTILMLAFTKKTIGKTVEHQKTY